MELKDKHLYYVGGVVRDKILGRESLDTDYCYEGNAIEFAQEKGLNIIQTNQQFGTVKVILDCKQIDIASTRKEIYPQKGHLPVVTEIGCSIKEDALRRDFTINSMSIRTTDNEFFDYWGGMSDIKKKLLRVMHKNSFVDDPTRIVRALKFAHRFNFELEPTTKEYQEKYLSNINYDMSYHRLKKELSEAFSVNSNTILNDFINQGIYNLLAANQKKPDITNITSNLSEIYSCKYGWLVYMSLFNIESLSLTRKEKNILNWAERLKTEHQTKQTPMESILIYKLRKEVSYA